MAKDEASRKVHKSSSKKHKRVEHVAVQSDSEEPTSTEPKTENTETTEPSAEPASATPKGTYDSVEKSWIWNVEADTRLTVRQFKGRMYVDIRKIWEGRPTKKGVSMSPEIFREIQNWPVEAALKAVKDQK